MLKKLHGLVYREGMSTRERLFRVVLLTGILISILALFAGIALEDTLKNNVPIFALFCVFFVSLVVTFKGRRLEGTITLIGFVLCCVIFPGVFFMSGGIQGGATIWFVLGILYIFVMFSGKKLFFFLGLAFVADVITYILAYNITWLVQPLASKSEVYYDSLFAVLTVGCAVGIVMQYHLSLLDRERKISLAQKAEIEQFVKSKDAFFVNMSHEIRTPINTIIGLNEMILRENISEEVAEDAINVRNAGKMLLELVNDILDYSKIQNERMDILPVRYDTKDLFRELVQMMENRIREKKLDFLVDIDEGLPAVLVGDEQRIKQVVINLLTNAVKYTDRGSVVLSVHGEVQNDGRLKLRISVADTGIGIKKEDVNKLFDAFARVNLEQNRKIEGSGLGLAITQQLVALMGGEITVDSIYRKGSTFTVLLEQPIADDTPIGPTDFMAMNQDGQRKRYQHSFEAPEARILIVDDDAMNLLVVTKLLRDTRMAIDTVQSGQECLECTKKRSYNLILLDYMMPDMDGTEVLQEIRKQENGMCRQASIIAFTAKAMPEREVRALGLDGYLPKPIDSVQLEAEIVKLLPEDIVIRKQEEQTQAMPLIGNLLNKKRNRIAITSESLCDISEELLEEFEIKLQHLYIKTSGGIFQDTIEIDSENIARYLSASDNTAEAISGSIEDYEALYADALENAEQVIHVSVASKVGRCYENAVEAARCFDHVHIVDSGHISSGEAIMVLKAAQMAKAGYEVDEICDQLEKMKALVNTSILFPSTGVFFKKGYTDKRTAWLCEHLEFYPVLRMRHNELQMQGFKRGNLHNARRKFIKENLSRKKKIRTDLLYITHAGCSAKEQKAILKEAARWADFERVILQKASVSNASNAGLGAIAMAYVVEK